MTKTAVSQIGKIVGQSINAYYPKVKPAIDEIKFKEKYQGRIIDCMVGEVDDNYIETPETDAPVVKLEHSKEGLVKVPSIKGKTILVDADGNETDTPGEGCRLVSVGEEEDNKLIILSKNKNLFPYSNISIDAKTNQTWYSLEGNMGMYGNDMWSKTKTWIYLPRGYIKVTTQELFNCGIQMVTPNEKMISYNGNSLFEGGYVTFRLRNNDTVNKFGYKNLMFEWSQSPILNNSNYIEPKQHKTEILLNEPLHKGNNIENNQLIKSFNKIFLDKETWTKLNADLENTILFELYINDAKSAISNHELSNIVCNRFNTRGVSNASGTWGTDIEGISINTNGRIHLRILKDRLTSLDEKGLIDWFIENPTEVLYELAEPVIEELPNSINLQGFDDTTMYIENSITPTVIYGYDALIPYKEELSNQKEEVETNTLDIEQNIIPYLMDMEFNLMLMEDNE